jgi:predicted dehydrogenase
VDDGVFGRAVQVEGDLSSDSGFRFTAAAWRTAPGESPAGPPPSLGIHHVDTVQCLPGPIARVIALRRRRVLDLAIDDGGTIVLELASGELGYLGTSFVLADRAGTLAVHGADARTWADEPAGDLRLRRRAAVTAERLAPEPVDAAVDGLAESAECVRSAGRPEVGGEEATADVAVLEAIAESGEAGRTVDVRR